MIIRKEKYETDQFIFWLTQYSEDSSYEYDIIFSARNVAPSATKQELNGLAEFIKSMINKNE